MEHKAKMNGRKSSEAAGLFQEWKVWVQMHVKQNSTAADRAVKVSVPLRDLREAKIQ